MPQVTHVYDVPAAGDPNPTVIRCTRVTSRMEISEDGSANGGFQQGLIGQQLTPTGFGKYDVGATFQIPPNLNQEPFVIAGYPADHPSHTVPIGNGGSGGQPVAPGGPATQGTVVAQFTSASANATKVRVVEWY